MIHLTNFFAKYAKNFDANLVQPFDEREPDLERSPARGESLPTAETTSARWDDLSVDGFDWAACRFAALIPAVDDAGSPNRPVAPGSSPSVAPECERVFSQTTTRQKTAGP